MNLTPILHEMSYEYDTGGIYLYRLSWSSERGFWKLQRRIKPINPNSMLPRWTRSIEVENYTQLNEFDPSAYARPIMKFEQRVDGERIIKDDSKIAAIKRTRAVEPR